MTGFVEKNELLYTFFFFFLIQKEKKEQMRTTEDAGMTFLKSSSFQSMLAKIIDDSLPLSVLWTLLLPTEVYFPL